MRGKLSNILNEGSCISEEMMLNYIAQKLNPQDQHRVEKHLLECALCSDALEGLSMSPVTQKQEANLKELGQRIDHLINRKGGKASGQLLFYRIAAIVVMVALFGGTLYYLQSIKKSEKIFTENFEPYRDTVHPTTPVAAVPPSIDETVKEEEEKVPAVHNQPEQKLADQARKDVPSQGVSRVQTITTGKSGTLNEGIKSSGSIAGAEYKKEDNVNDISVSEAKDAEFVVVDAEKGNKKMEADESKSGDVLTKNTQPAKPLRGESLKTKSSSNDKQVRETAAPSYELSTAATSDGTGSASNELIIEGIRQYEAKNYTAAISNLRQVLSKEPGNPEALFYNGVSNLSMNEDEVAINMLESVLTNSPNKFSDAAKWYLSLTYVKKNKISKAKKLLRDLSRGNSEYKSVAQKTLDELK